MRQPLPDSIKSKMTTWRHGFTCFPQEYVDFHKDLAQKELERLRLLGVEVHRSYVASDGWMDGMRCLWAVVEYKGNLMKLHWHDGNQEFFRQGSGSWPLCNDFRELRAPEAPAVVAKEKP